MGRPKMYRPRPVDREVLAGLLDESVKILRHRHFVLKFKTASGVTTADDRAEFSAIDSLLGKRDAIFAAAQPVARNGKFFNSSDEDR